MALFIALQMLDAATTLIGLRMGGFELSPFVAWLIRLAGPVGALVAVKVLGCGIGAFCFRFRPPALAKLNVISGLIVAWNIANIARVI